MLYPAQNDVSNGTYTEVSFVHMLKAGSAHRQFMGQSINRPLLKRLIINFGADDGHFVIVAVSHLISLIMNSVT